MTQIQISDKKIITGNFAWSQHEGSWYVVGDAGNENQTVIVTKKSGHKQTIMIGGDVGDGWNGSRRYEFLEEIFTKDDKIEEVTPAQLRAYKNMTNAIMRSYTGSRFVIPKVDERAGKREMSKIISQLSDMLDICSANEEWEV